MATGQSGYDADDFFDQRRYDYQREQDLSDRFEQDRRRDEDARRAALDEQRRIQLEANRARLDAMRRIVNDDDVELSPEEVEIINNKDTRMMPNGEIVNRRKNGLRTIRSSGQFALQNIIPNLSNKTKRKRKKTKTDRNMSKALRLANEKFRTASGKLRKGATQAKIMKYAHRLLKKM